MASPHSLSPVCIMLVCGIPGSGKTVLTDFLVSQCTDLNWAALPVHCDDFYTPDTRADPSTAKTNKQNLTGAGSGARVEDSSTSVIAGVGGGGDEKEEQGFELKIERQRIRECIEWLVQGRESVRRCKSEGDQPPLWDTFRNSITDYEDILDRLRSDSIHSPIMIMIDDNFHLRSMRYQYYQLAKKYYLGFAQVCIYCNISIATSRNASRPIPILHSTIVGMERRLELPEPSKHYWEARSAVLYNSVEKREDFLRRGWAVVKDLLVEAIANPEQPVIVPVDVALKEASRAANLSSYLHQADVVLRKSVSASFKHFAGHDRAALAARANACRRDMLAEVRTGGLLAASGLLELSPTSEEFERELQQLFWDKLREQV